MSATAASRLFDEPGTRAKDPWESFELEGSVIHRFVRRRSGLISSSSLSVPSQEPRGADAIAHDAAWLRSTSRPGMSKSRSSLAIADLFCGAGGLSLGASEACRALDVRPCFVFSSDSTPAASGVYRSNFHPTKALTDPIEDVIDGDLGGRTTSQEKQLKRQVGSVDLVLAGPPCQGHSDLNNHTRRADAKNRLVLKVARFVELFEPQHLLIENVQGIRHDRFGALDAASKRLMRLGYRIADGIVSAEAVGVPQTRRRYFLFATTHQAHSLDDIRDYFPHGGRTVRWAIGDLARTSARGIFDQASMASPTNARRIDYLFDHDLYDLPDRERPRCHADGEHTYRAVYGRLRWDHPAPTITTGFGCMGQGRFVHPSMRRTLTPHEAARLQFFPDFFKFGNLKRGEYQQLIGNAVPPQLAYAVLLHQLA